MSAAPGRTTNLHSGKPNAPMNMGSQGGRPRTMIVGMGMVVLGLYGFWRLQFAKQNRSQLASSPAEMPTWQFRHAQQSAEFNERMSAPGATGAVANADVLSQSGGQPQPSTKASTTDKVQTTSSEDGGVRRAISQGSNKVKNVAASVLTTLHGDPKEANDSHVSQPAAPKRLNDRGGIYTKNSDYKDGYRRD
ncbi:hypothetical protein C8Q78DRAFT_961659 [Trametes maxima]|nr:hypothetical protein C8Q78DRAFT_961659 [Trametes maxima]